jgi:Cu(I)/Ag(I) efflux system membrane fusion protein
MKTKINITKREVIIIAIAVIAGLFLGWLLFNRPDRVVARNGDHVAGYEMGHDHEEEATIWTCSMHPQIRMDKPGKCPICAMDLIPVDETGSGVKTTSPDEIQMTEEAMKIADVQTLRVLKDYPFNKTYLLGKVTADERNIAELTGRFGGRIEKLYVNFTGQHVTKGEPLATIYSPVLVTAQKELLEAAGYKESNPELYRTTKNKLMLWDLSEEQVSRIEQSGEIRYNFDVLSPLLGTVTIRHVSPGDYIREGSPLFQVIDLSHVWVMFEAYETDLPWISLNDRVDFSVKSLPGKTFNGKVKFIDPLIDPKTRVAQVRVELDNPGGQLKPGMFTSGVFISGKALDKKELLIPKTAVLWTGKRAVVYLKVPGRDRPSFMYREILLGPEAGEYWVVAEGLEEGEEIAVNGVFRIDASAQLAGKPSMMNPRSGSNSSVHNHGDMQMDMSSSKEVEQTANQPAMEHTMFKVSGNCGMCKDRIETVALELEGVRTADWDIDSKILHLMYDKNRVTLEEVHKRIALAGHDTELEKAPDEVYRNLPECCLYRK